MEQSSSEQQIPYTIRAATREDAPILHYLIQELATYYGKSDAPKINSVQLGDDLASNHFHALLAFAQNGDPAGYALYYLPCLSSVGCVLYLEDIFVLSKFRRHHVGFQLMRELRKIGGDGEKDCRCIELMVSRHNEGARAFCHSLGFDDMSKGNAAINLWKVEGRPAMESIVDTAQKESTLNDVELIVATDGPSDNGWKASSVAKDLIFDTPLAGDEVPAAAAIQLLRRGRIGSVIARQQNKTVGIGIFHQKAYSSFLGSRFLVVDRLAVRGGFHRKGVGMVIAAELAKITLSAGYPKMFWTAKQGNDVDNFFNKLNACNMTREEGWLLHRWYRAKWPSMRKWPQLLVGNNNNNNSARNQ